MEIRQNERARSMPDRIVVDRYAWPHKSAWTERACLTLLLVSAAACAGNAARIRSVERMPQYDALFSRQQGWTGADGAYTVALDDETTLWLFSDTWIGPVVDGKHKDATMVNNSVALQKGKDPNTASVDFFWGSGPDGRPKALVEPADGVGWFWIFDGVLAHDKLYLFLMQIVRTDEKGVWGFKQVGAVLGELANWRDAPPAWRIRQRKIPFGCYADSGNTFFGSAVMKTNGFVYIYGAREDRSRGPGGRGMIVARVAEEALTDFSRWRFHADGTWSENFHDVTESFRGFATECSVSYQPPLQQYVATYTECGMSAKILIRTAPTPVGPWSAPRQVYECPENKWHETYFCYAAKGHPELSRNDDLVITYVCNAHDFWQMARDARIYRPRFIRITFEPTAAAAVKP